MAGPPLVQVELNGMVGGVVVDGDGRPCLGVWPTATEPVPLTVLHPWVPMMIGAGSGVVVGGRLRVAAVEVELQAANGEWQPGRLGDEYWVGWAPGSDISEPLPPYRFRGGDGDLLRVAPPRTARPLSDFGWPTSHTPGPCPACSGSVWLGLEGDGAGGAHLICERCGYTDGGVHGVYGV
jgi:hypothetical protein